MASTQEKGIVFDIKRYAIHDGPGIRTTVFFKGCPLHCHWCHNPEGEHPEPEIIWHRNRCLTECRDCIPVCTRKALQKKGRTVHINRTLCNLCGDCADVCPTEAMEIIGRQVTVGDVMEIIQKDLIFYEESGGGVTFSGGEPLMQPEFLAGLLDACRQTDIPAAVDTCGYVPSGLLERMADKVDLFLYDVKLIDEEKHKRHTGASNKLILENLRMLSNKGKRVIIRIPLLRDVNDQPDNIHQTIEFLLPQNNLREINLLPYHRGGEEKRKRLDKKNSRRTFQSASENRIQNIKKIFEGQGFSVKTGG